MGLKEEIEKLKYDTRLIDLNLTHRRLTPAELEKHLGALTDCAANCEQMDKLEDGHTNGHTESQLLHS